MGRVEFGEPLLKKATVSPDVARKQSHTHLRRRQSSKLIRDIEKRTTTRHAVHKGVAFFIIL
jgi:hypothetical protein